MAVLDIITAPHPILELRASEVEEHEFGPELVKHLKNMAETMYAAPGVGLAGPQVSDPRRILVIDSGERDERGTRLRLMCNPVIVEKSKDFITWRETCLSVPEFEVDVQRHRVIKVKWRHPDGTPMEDVFEDYEAVIVQHEMDHLLGTIILEKASRFKRSRYLKKVSKARSRAGLFAR